MVLYFDNVCASEHLQHLTGLLEQKPKSRSNEILFCHVLFNTRLPLSYNLKNWWDNLYLARHLMYTLGSYQWCFLFLQMEIKQEDTNKHNSLADEIERKVAVSFVCACVVISGWMDLWYTLSLFLFCFFCYLCNLRSLFMPLQPF